MNIYTEAAKRLIDKFGHQEARIINAKDRDQSSWGTASHAWHVQVGKEIERLRNEYKQAIYDAHDAREEERDSYRRHL